MDDKTLVLENVQLVYKSQLLIKIITWVFLNFHICFEHSAKVMYLSFRGKSC